MMVISVSLISRILLGSHIAKRASVPGSQVPSSAFTEGPSQTETVTRRATQSKQKSAEPQGAGKAPKRDPEKRTGNETAEHTLDSVQPRFHGGIGHTNNSLLPPSYESQNGWH